MNRRTYVIKPEEVVRAWHLMDAEGQVLGRLATKAAHLLRGKHKPTYTPHVDCGDGIVVINAEKIRVTGNKMESKQYKRYSGYPGGLRLESMEHLISRRPTEVVRRAIVGMLSKNTLGKSAAKRLKIYAGAEHPHESQISVKRQASSIKKERN